MTTVPRRTVDPLEPLLAALQERIGVQRQGAEDIDAAIRSAVRAVVPGRQQAKNLRPLIEAARKAFIRTIRRRAALTA